MNDIFDFLAWHMFLSVIAFLVMVGICHPRPGNYGPLSRLKSALLIISACNLFFAVLYAGHVLGWR